MQQEQSWLIQKNRIKIIMVNSEMKHRPYGENNAGSYQKSSALSVSYDYARENLRDLSHDNEDFMSCISFTIASIVTNNRDFNPTKWLFNFYNEPFGVVLQTFDKWNIKLKWVNMLSVIECWHCTKNEVFH